MKTTPQRVLCFGDSLIYGLRDSAIPERHPLTDRVHILLQNILGPNYTVLDEGLRSRLIAIEDPLLPDKNGLNYLRPCLESIEPDILILWLGTNHTKRHLGQTAETILSQFNEMYLWAQNRFPAMQIIVIPPPQIKPEYYNEPMSKLFEGRSAPKITEYQKLLSTYCIERKLIYLKELESLSADSVDGIHLSLESNKTVANAIACAIRTKRT